MHIFKKGDSDYQDELNSNFGETSAELKQATAEIKAWVASQITASNQIPNVYLAEGVWSLNSTQTITPTKALTECRVGWMFIFDTYNTSNGQPRNTDYTAFIVPKNFAGVLSIPVTAANGNLTYKHVRINNTQIIGLDGNNNTDSMTVVMKGVKEV
ncbi:hypothetical protein [Enterococcus rotai]|uniref:hypothetical protein n=1 Tax=Enterococcus rotai TaxID=118060 RepID=UPI0035C72C07